MQLPGVTETKASIYSNDFFLQQVITTWILQHPLTLQDGHPLAINGVWSYNTPANGLINGRWGYNPTYNWQVPIL